MRQFYTYLHCKPDGTPFYVGKGCGQRARRLISIKRNSHHQNIVKKYGVQNIKVYIFECASEEEAFRDEEIQIAQLRAQGYLLANRTDGGEGTSGYRFTDEMKRAMRGDPRRVSRPMLGRKHSDESKAKMAAANLGRKHTEQSRMNMALSRLGKKRGAPSEETRAKIGAGNKGKIISVETRAKMSAAHQKRLAMAA